MKGIRLLKNIFSLVVFALPLLMQAQSYPFELPDTVKATYNIDSSHKEAFNNKIIGYNIFEFSDAKDKDFIRKFDPITIRFPHGVWANFYNWETDGYTRYDDTLYNNDPHTSVIENYIKYNIRGGFLGLTALHNDKKLENSGKGYDILWTYNMNYDSNKKSVARLRDSEAKGFNLFDIEMSNEHFWKNQRSTRTSTPEKFVVLAKSLADTLRKVRPDVRVSIPLSWRTSHADYNSVLADNKEYFDAITVHKYSGGDPDVPGESNKAYSNVLTARLDIAKDVNFARSFAPGKPVWLTEWGVSAGDECQAAAVLGMADSYLYMFENQDVYERANWFSVNGVLNSFVTFSSGRNVKYPLQKTGYGSAYEILRSVFENSTLLGGKMTTNKLTTTLGSTNTVNARAVIKDGTTILFAVNLSNKPVDFIFKFNDTLVSNHFLHESMAFNSLSEDRILDIDVNPLNPVKYDSGTIILPPLSLNKVTFYGEINNATNFVSFTNIFNGDVVEIGSDIRVNAVVGSAIKEVSLYVNDTLVRTITSEPYQWGYVAGIDVALANLSEGNYVLKLIGKDDKDSLSYARLIISTKEEIKQLPYKGTPAAIPGRIEAEDYDLGGEGIAYHDSDDFNQVGDYRNDGVDIGSGSIGYSNSGEWLEYTIDVLEDGDYDLNIYYSSARPGGGAKIGASLPDEEINLISSFDLPVTGTWSDKKEITLGNFSLNKGIHVLRIKVVERGYNLDWIELITKGDVANKKLFFNSLNIYPNPNSTGVFNIKKSYSWEVYSILGENILKGKGQTIDLSDFSKGIYIIKTEHSVNKVLYY